MKVHSQAPEEVRGINSENLFSSLLGFPDEVPAEQNTMKAKRAKQRAQ
jgi:hypothetical protein